MTNGTLNLPGVLRADVNQNQGYQSTPTHASGIPSPNRRSPDNGLLAHRASNLHCQVADLDAWLSIDSGSGLAFTELAVQSATS